MNFSIFISDALFVIMWQSDNTAVTSPSESIYDMICVFGAVKIFSKLALDQLWAHFAHLFE